MKTDSLSEFNTFDDRVVLPISIMQRPMTTRRRSQLLAEIGAPETRNGRASKPEDTGSEPPVLKESTGTLDQATSDFPKYTSAPETKARILAAAPQDHGGQNNKQHTNEDLANISTETAESPCKDPPSGLILHNEDILALPMSSNGKGESKMSDQDFGRAISMVTEVEFCTTCKDPCKNLVTQEEVARNMDGNGKKSDCSPETVTQVEVGATAGASSGISITQEESLPPMMELASGKEEKMEPAMRKLCVLQKRKSINLNHLVLLPTKIYRPNRLILSWRHP